MSQVAPNVIAAHELEYKKFAYSHPSYRYHKVLPLVNPNANVSVATTVTSTLTLPTNLLANFYKSYIQFDWEYKMEEDVSLKVWADTYGIVNAVSLYDASGTFLAKCENLQNYVKVVGKKNLTLSDVLTRDRDLQPIHPNNSLVGDPNALRPQYAAGSAESKANIAYFEPSYIHQEAKSGATAQAPITKKYSVRLLLSDLKDAGVFSVSRDIPLMQNYTMDITFGSGQKTAYTGSAANAADTGAADLLRDIRVSNIRLMLAIEENQDVTDSVLSRVKSRGFSMLVPFLSAFKAPRDNTNHSITHPFTIKEGRRLQKVIHTAFAPGENKNLAYDCSNINGSKIESYKTTLNSKDRQNFLVDCKTQYDDYMLNKRFIKGSAMLNRNVYQYNWFHCDDFTELPNPGDDPLPIPSENCEAGVPITVDTPVLWMTEMTTTGPLNHYYWSVGQKLLTITPERVTCD